MTRTSQTAQRSKKFDLARNFQSRSKFLISLENFSISTSRPTKNRAKAGGSLEKFILARNFQSRSKSRIFLIFGPSGFSRQSNLHFRNFVVMALPTRNRVFLASHHGALLCQKNSAISSFLSLEFWCSEGHLAQFSLILTPFRPIPTYFKPFCQADLTYFYLFGPIFPGRPGLFSPIWTYFVSQ